MREQYQTERGSERPGNPQEGVKSLRAACSTLSATPPHLIRSMHVTVPLGDFPLPETYLVELAERVAAEYGLVARAKLAERRLEVHLARAGDPLAGGKDR